MFSDPSAPSILAATNALRIRSLQASFRLIQNPCTVMLELSLVRLNDVFETGVVKNVIIFLPLRDRIAEEIPYITII